MKMSDLVPELKLNSLTLFISSIYILVNQGNCFPLPSHYRKTSKAFHQKQAPRRHFPLSQYSIHSLPDRSANSLGSLKAQQCSYALCFFLSSPGIVASL